MVFGSVAVAVPTKVEAAHSVSSSHASSMTAEKVKEIVQASYKNTYLSVDEMLADDIKNGYLDSVTSASAAHTIYVNRYTGVMYYKNNATGEVLSSNPYNLSGASSNEIRSNLMSQLFISFHESANASNTTTYNSSQWAGQYGQISVSPIANGLRVSYTLGDTSTRFALPGAILASDYVEKLMKPMMAFYRDILVQYCGEAKPNEQFDFFATGTYDGQSIWDANKPGTINKEAFINFINKTELAYKELYPGTTTDARIALDSVKNNIMKFGLKYNVDNQFYKEDLGYRYTYEKTASVQDKRLSATTIALYCPDYSMSEALLDEETAGFKNEIEQKPVFRVALEYTFNADDESLSVRLPANSITFDETVYTLDNISSMRYFGAGDVTKDGYVFVPDGSGSVINFRDFYNENEKQNVSLSLRMYGEDYCYSMLDAAGAHREQITMPVFGVVSTSNVYGADGEVTAERTGGYFAILEEGSSLAGLRIEFGGNYHRAANVYTTFQPFPQDQYDLSDTISVGGAKSYTIVSESKYTGSYVTRYVLLSDASNASVPGYVASSYSGMASYYRAYLEARGQITPITEAAADLPLYIEAFGSMDIVKRILTFPVTASIPLTTFENVTTMYDELSTAKTVLLNKAAEYDATAIVYESAKEYSLAAKAKEKADNYRKLADEVFNITNVNFKLTGFTNGGMYFTYPTKVKWQSACGGKSGFNQLMTDVAHRQSLGLSMNVYPDFDFQYINYTAAFDGIGNKGNVSKMVDNRYASRQEFNSILREYESVFAMVISADALDGLYTKFFKSYSKSGISNISVATLGSDLNSNFDEKNPINREEASAHVVALLDKMVSENNLSVMTAKGNIYSVKYADHIIDIATDSSHFSYSSYSVPFTGLVLHGYVNYAGSALNYSGSPDYDLLHAIENGASLYYILSYQNSEYMKEDLVLNDYYGVDYQNWYDSVVENYAVLNGAIGQYQTYNIVDHTVLIAERVVDAAEEAENFAKLRAELVEMAREQLLVKIDEAYEAMAADPANIGRGVKVVFNTEALMLQATGLLNKSYDELAATDFDEALAALKLAFETEYCGTSENPAVVDFGSVEYNTKYEYVTDSFATDGKNYDYTDLTVDNNLVTMVTYKDRVTGDTVYFLINYNIYAVKVNLGGTVYTLDKYGFAKIGGAQNG